MKNKYKRKRLVQKENNINEINVVPYIDVMLVLLAIFMFSAPLLFQQINVSLPQTKSEPDNHLKKSFLIITINDKKEFEVNFTGKVEKKLKKIPIEKIKLYLKKNNLNQIFIKADKKIEYGYLINIMDKLKNENINNIGLITKKKE